MPSYLGGLILPSSGGTCSFRGSISGAGVGVGRRLAGRGRLAVASPQ